MTSLQKYTRLLFFLLFLPSYIFCQKSFDNYISDNNKMQQYRSTYFGGAISYAATTGNLNDVSDAGIGIHFLIDKEVTDILSVTGDIGWTNFFGKEGFKSQNGLFLEAGSKAGIAFVYVETRAGYYFGDLKQFTFTPSLGFTFNSIDFNFGYQLAGNRKWFPLRIGYYFNGDR